MKIGELIVNVFEKLVTSNLINPEKEIFRNLMDVDYCTKNLNLISRGVRYPLFLKGDAGDKDSDLTKPDGTRRYYSINYFDYTYKGVRYFLCSQLEEAQKEYFSKWFMEFFSLDILQFADSKKVLFAKNIINNKYFYVLENYPPSCSVNFASCGLRGETGVLTQRVLSYTGNIDASPETVFRGLKIDDKEYNFLPVAPRYPESKINILNSKDIILKKISNKNSVWLPLMGVGDGEIPLNEAFEMYASLIEDIFNSFGSGSPTIVMEVPSNKNFREEMEGSEFFSKISLLINFKYSRVIDIFSQFLSDVPSEVDAFNRKDLAVSFVSWIKKSQIYTNESAMLLLTADWGEGKTTFANYFKTSAQKNGWDTFFVNAWEFQRFMPNWWGIIYSIEKQILKNKKNRMLFWCSNLKDLILNNIGSVLFVLIIFVGIALLNYYKVLEQGKNTLELVLLAQLAVWIVPLKYIKNLIEHRSEVENDKITTAKAHFEKLITIQRGHSDNPIIIFIDDLDRCESSKLYCFLEGIRNFLQIKGVVFIVCAEEGYVVNGVGSFLKGECHVDDKESSSEYGARFLQKLFQGTIRLNKNITFEQYIEILKYRADQSPGEKNHRDVNKDEQATAAPTDTDDIKEVNINRENIDEEITREYTLRFVNSIIEEALKNLGYDVQKQLTPRGLKRWHNYLSLVILAIRVEGVELAENKQLQREIAIISLLNSCFYHLYFKNFLLCDLNTSEDIEAFNNVYISKKALSIYLGKPLN